MDWALGLEGVNSGGGWEPPGAGLETRRSEGGVLMGLGGDGLGAGLERVNSGGGWEPRGAGLETRRSEGGVLMGLGGDGLGAGIGGALTAEVAGSHRAPGWKHGAPRAVG